MIPTLHLRILVDHFHPFIPTVFHLPMAATSMITCNVAKAVAFSNCRLEHGEELTAPQWPSQTLVLLRTFGTWQTTTGNLQRGQTTARSEKKSYQAEDFFHHFVEATSKNDGSPKVKLGPLYSQQGVPDKVALSVYTSA